MLAAAIATIEHSLIPRCNAQLDQPLSDAASVQSVEIQRMPLRHIAFVGAKSEVREPRISAHGITRIRETRRAEADGEIPRT